MIANLWDYQLTFGSMFVIALTFIILLTIFFLYLQWRDKQKK